MEDKAFVIAGLVIFVLIIIIVVVLVSLKSKSTKKEGFIVVNGPAQADAMGTISSGTGILTDSTIKAPYEDILKSVKDNHRYAEDGSVGVGQGDCFDETYESMKQIQAIDGGSTGVKNQEEMSKISKQINATSSNNNACIFNRAGTTRAKIYLEPYGTAPVCQQFTPERDKNRKIRLVNNIVEVPGYDIDTNRISDQFDSQGMYAIKEESVDGKALVKGVSTAKMFSPNVPKTITACGYAGPSIPSQALAGNSSASNMTTETFTMN
jgi:hypothetical protein